MSKNILDSRDLEKELTDLLEQYEDWKSNLTDEQLHTIAESLTCEASELTEEDFRAEWFSFEGDDALKHIEELKNQEIYGWDDGVTFVKDSYFKEFAEEEAGLVENKQWPYDCIDWEKAANRLQMDYSSVEFDGETYWYRDC